MHADDTGTLKIIYAQTFSLVSLLNFQKPVWSISGTRLSRNSSISANRGLIETLHFIAASSGSSSSSACVNMSSKRSPRSWPCKCLVQLQHVIIRSQWATVQLSWWRVWRLETIEPLFGKTCATTQKKNVKSHVFWILKKKRKKNVKNVHFTVHLITQPLILNYRKSVPVSHQHQTSCSEIRTQETMQLRNVCDKRL